jgi:hypothetical protein
MYSDDEQDSDDNDQNKFILSKFSPPYLQLYERQEEQTILLRLRIKSDIEAGEADASALHRGYEDIYPVLRFFGTVEGFFTVRSPLPQRRGGSYLNI